MQNTVCIYLMADAQEMILLQEQDHRTSIA